MADLTRLLSDIYGPPQAGLPPLDDTEPETTPFDDEMESFTDVLTEATPIWDNEESLDEVFAAWQPGPDEHASAGEHEMVAGAIDEEAVATWQAPVASEIIDEAVLDEWAPPGESEEVSSGTQVSDWYAHIPEVPVAEVQLPSSPQFQVSWNRSNDNILPAGVASRGLSFFRR